MATLTVQKITTAGIIPTYNAATSGTGDVIPNADGKTFIHIKNIGAASVTVAATAVTPCDFGTLHSLSYTVSATSGEAVIALSKRLNSGGNVNLSYTGSVSGLTIAVYNYPGTL